MIFGGRPQRHSSSGRGSHQTTVGRLRLRTCAGRVDVNAMNRDSQGPP